MAQGAGPLERPLCMFLLTIGEMGRGKGLHIKWGEETPAARGGGASTTAWGTRRDVLGCFRSPICTKEKP